MGLDGCGIVCIFVIVFFSIALAVGGGAFLLVGLFLRFNTNTRVAFEIESLQSWVFVMDVKIIIGLGSFMLITALIGFCGSSSKNRWVLETFACLVVLLLVPALVLLGFTFGDKKAVVMNFIEFYASMSVLYDGVDPVIGTTLTIIHNLLHCCGVTGISLLASTCPKPSGFLEHLVMPNCPEKIAGLFDRTGLLIGSFIAFIILLLVPVFCSETLCKKIRAPVPPPQYNVITNYSLLTPQPLQQGYVPTSSCSYPDPDPDMLPLVTVAEAPAVKA